ncbi:MAG: hypothetical protein IT376_16120 [Polyangiaceae bacterium]|nr:hypothetical protein [Polyangiaceae bacterium]
MSLARVARPCALVAALLAPAGTGCVHKDVTTRPVTTSRRIAVDRGSPFERSLAPRVVVTVRSGPPGEVLVERYRPCPAEVVEKYVWERREVRTPNYSVMVAGAALALVSGLALAAEPGEQAFAFLFLGGAGFVAAPPLFAGESVERARGGERRLAQPALACDRAPAAEVEVRVGFGATARVGRTGADGRVEFPVRVAPSALLVEGRLPDQVELLP